MASSTVSIRWCGNGSVRYDGKINNVPLKAIFPEDVAAGLEVGKLVQVRWGGEPGRAYWYASPARYSIHVHVHWWGLEMLSWLVNIPYIISQPC